MKNIINCKNIEEFIKSLKNFKKNNDDCFFVVQDVFTELKVGFKAITNDDEFLFTCRLSELKNNNQILSEEDYKIIQQYFNMRVELSKLEKSYIKLFTNQE